LIPVIIALGSVGLQLFAADQPPTEWIDPDTGHRIVRLSPEPGSKSLYFNQNAFAADGDKMVITTPQGIAAVNLKTRSVELIVRDAKKVSGIVAGRKSRQVYYVKPAGSNLVAFATDLDTRATREIGTVPQGGFLMTVNADDTLLAGSFVESGEPVLQRPEESKGEWMRRRIDAHTPMALFTLNIKTGELKTFGHSTDWLNHVQFSPTDPSLLLFCHEGPWDLVDRIWIIRTDGTGLKEIQPRTMDREIAGHEFFSADGKWIWYDLQTPRGENFWLAGYEIATGSRLRYHLERGDWSVHYNISPDGSIFAGDGGAENMVAHAKNGKWIYLFHPVPGQAPAGIKSDTNSLIQTATVKVERLVNMSKHNYHLEPNVNFTPDGKWVVFRSNMFGPTHVFAVEVAKAGR
jgi:oligogalacturonide lyase